MGCCVYQLLYKLCALSTVQVVFAQCLIHQKQPQRNSLFQCVLLTRSQSQHKGIICFMLRAAVFMLWLKKSQQSGICAEETAQLAMKDTDLHVI